MTTSLFDIAADLDTPVSAYLKLKPFKPRFLLESVEGGERLALLDVREKNKGKEGFVVKTDAELEKDARDRVKRIMAGHLSGIALSSMMTISSICM